MLSASLALYMARVSQLLHECFILRMEFTQLEFYKQRKR